MPRRVCVVLVDRANYGRLKPVIAEIQRHPELELQVLAAGTMVLERFDQPVRLVRQDGFPVDGEVYLELEGSTPATMAKSLGFGIVEFASELHRLKPDLVVLIGDRYEALAAALAAAYMNITIVHFQGGEVSGSIDESARHAITKVSHYHAPATERAKRFVLQMGERPDTVIGVGCPSSDLALRLDTAFDPALVNGRGSGVVVDFARPFLLAVFHPTTTEYGGESAQMWSLLQALEQIAMQTLILWPNIDAGADHIGKAIRQFRDRHEAVWLRAITNLAPEVYLKVLATTACAVGNSSSFVRDAGYFGTPVVLVGNRQNYRESDAHVVRVPADTDAIAATMRRQLDHGRYPASTLYGDGGVASRVVARLPDLALYKQKHLAYVM